MTSRTPLLTAALLAAFSLALPPASALAQARKKSPVDEIPPFEVVQINNNTWHGRFGMTNCGWLEMGDGVLVIDTGGTVTDAVNLMAQIKKTTNGKPVRWFVLTHLHSDSNDGLQAFLPTDATIFVNAHVAPVMEMALKAKTSGVKQPTIVGVDKRLVLAYGGRALELLVPDSAAHTDNDLYAFLPEASVVFVGDLVTPGRCPMLSDPTADPQGWLQTLDRLEAASPAFLVPTRGSSTKLVKNEIDGTREYIKRVVSLLVDAKKRGFPEARVSSELFQRKLGDYCPSQLDSINALALYRRVGIDGKFARPAPPARRKK